MQTEESVFVLAFHPSLVSARLKVHQHSNMYIYIYKTLLEVQLLERKVGFHNASGLDPGPQHILLCGDVICLSNPLQIVQVTKTRTQTE